MYIFIILLLLAITILSPVAPTSNFALNTRKIDKHIKFLLKEAWFTELYQSKEYRHLFFANKQVRKRLSSQFFVQRLTKNEKQQIRFIIFLKKENRKSIK